MTNRALDRIEHRRRVDTVMARKDGVRCKRPVPFNMSISGHQACVKKKILHGTHLCVPSRCVQRTGSWLACPSTHSHAQLSAGEEKMGLGWLRSGGACSQAVLLGATYPIAVCGVRSMYFDIHPPLPNNSH